MAAKIDRQTLVAIKSEITELLSTTPVSTRSLIKHLAPVILSAVSEGASRRQVAISLGERLKAKGIDTSVATLRKYVSDIVAAEKPKNSSTGVIEASRPAPVSQEAPHRSEPAPENPVRPRRPAIVPPEEKPQSKTVILAGVDAFVSSESST